MKKNTLKLIFTAVLAAALTVTMASCKKEKTSVQTVIVGTGSTSKLY